MHGFVGKHALNHLGSSREGNKPVALGDPVLTGAAWVGRQDKLDRHAVLGAKHTVETINRRSVWILTSLLNPSIGDVAALVLVSIGDRIKISKADTSAARHAPLEFGPVEFTAQ